MNWNSKLLSKLCGALRLSVCQVAAGVQAGDTGKERKSWKYIVPEVALCIPVSSCAAYTLKSMHFVLVLRVSGRNSQMEHSNSTDCLHLFGRRHGFFLVCAGSWLLCWQLSQVTSIGPGDLGADYWASPAVVVSLMVGGLGALAAGSGAQAQGLWCVSLVAHAACVIFWPRGSLLSVPWETRADS